MVQVAQIGVGHWGRNLARNFAALEALGAIVENHHGTASELAAQYPGVPVRGWDEVLADADIHGVSIATPADTHVEIACAALEAGKHVFIEKPFAMSLSGARRIADAAERAGRVAMAGHLLRYHPVFERLLAELRAGRIGKPQYIYSNRLSLGKIWHSADVLWELGPHDLSMVLAIAGADPTEIDARGASFVTPGVADWAIVQMRFPGGIAAHVSLSWLHPFKEQRLVVQGETGALVFEDSQPDWERKLMHYATSLDRSGPCPVIAPDRAEPIAVPRGEPLRAECAHFIDCIATGATPRTGSAEAIAVTGALEAAAAAIATRATSLQEEREP